MDGACDDGPPRPKGGFRCPRLNHRRGFHGEPVPLILGRWVGARSGTTSEYPGAPLSRLRVERGLLRVVPECLGGGLVPVALHALRGGAVEQLSVGDERVDLVEARYMRCVHASHDMVRCEFAGVIEAHGGEKLCERVDGVSVEPVDAVRFVGHDEPAL